MTSCLNLKHLDTARCGYYFILKNGLFCVSCFLFAKKFKKISGKGDHENLRQLVTSPCIYSRKLYGKDGCITLHLEAKSNY